MPADRIRVHNARQHNLKGVTVDIPHRRLTVITGPSGSGKSSLAFDTLYAEGQRRYIEALSTYAKQFLERMPRPAVDRIEGIAPAVAIEQKNPTTTSRSTVGTATEIHDYLRLLWARIGHPYCHSCGAPIRVDSPSTAAQRAVAQLAGQDVLVTFAPPRPAGAGPDQIRANLQALGFVRVLVGGEGGRLDQIAPQSMGGDDFRVIADRVRAGPDTQGRLADAVATCFAEGDGVAELRGSDQTLAVSQRPRCTACGQPAPPVSPALFSFNNPRGACPGCNGFGAVLEYHESLIVPRPERSLADGALDPWTKPRYGPRRKLLADTARHRGIPLDVPWNRLRPVDRRFLLHGKSGKFRGVLPFLETLEAKRYKQYIRVFLRQYQLAVTCPACGGARLRPEALAVRVADASIAQVSALTAGDLHDWLAKLELTAFEREVAQTILVELRARVGFLCEVGLGYLTLDRLTRTLSGGEAQRIALANALGASLVDTLYVLDEPSIGLHQRDVDRLMGQLLRLRTAGNTVVIVEHDPGTIRRADHMIELGPGSGEAGGHVVYAGPVAGALTAGTLTGDYLASRRRIAVPSARRPAGPRWLKVEGARLHNLRGMDAAIPLGTLTVVTGVSGSGKSTLVHDVLYRQLRARITGAHGAKEHLGEAVGQVDRMSGWESLDDVVLIDQSPIGRTPRSNPVTYIRAFDDIRALFAAEPLAQARGYTPATFSFNAPRGGRCRSCDGAGHVQVEMIFLADVFVPCDACGGARFEPEVLDVRVQGLSVHEVLNLTVDGALTRFRRQPALGRMLWQLQQVGLGYLRLGQPATTLSGGEAQRLKIARQLATVRKGERRLYIMDEPTTGLHLEDVRTLLRVLDRLVDAGHTVLVIEHHLDVIKRADWLLDVGPDAGEAGGCVVAAGTPEEVATADTHTARYLRAALSDPPADTRTGAGPLSPPVAAATLTLR
ncbi:MAG TPA: excinuclease ABC subunit UvrA [Gemmatimonadales bacterium]